MDKVNVLVVSRIDLTHDYKPKWLHVGSVGINYLPKEVLMSDVTITSGRGSTALRSAGPYLPTPAVRCPRQLQS
jgi:hypothetical protein